MTAKKTDQTVRREGMRTAQHLPNSVQSESIQADYHNGVLTLSLPKREEAKPKQIKINVGTSPVNQALSQQAAPQQRSLAAAPGAR